MKIVDRLWAIDPELQWPQVLNDLTFLLYVSKILLNKTVR
jgi:hypothetical protein